MKTKPPADFGNDAVSQAMKPIYIEKIKRDAFTAGRVAGLREASKICARADTYDTRKASGSIDRVANRLEADATPRERIEVKIEVEESLIEKIRSRRDVGRKKYGVSMERTDLTELQWLLHAQEEAMDLAIYLEKLIQDKKGVRL